MLPSEPLRYPDHYPPTNRWKKFFIGVRWLGPDLSFFGHLRQQQASRTVELMGIWGGGEPRSLAIAVGAIFSRHLHWASPYFVPDDPLSVVAGGPRFGAIDSDLDVSDALGEIEEMLGVPLGPVFWRDAAGCTMGELVERLLQAASQKP
ncbi:hypothetical protein SAMN05216570_3439 [Dyella sp. OK004]|uniref:hypothetical protein n=1 Tax=Dyella sp. OK004 TaxID=1855292 RepID=UPI0008F1C820|nr:hypothetical protein [Dyella sp. OK004]SFS16992.1 hypothetical protein SAMN05216570_3439 [Dyella sp. OK004]